MQHDKVLTQAFCFTLTSLTVESNKDLTTWLNCLEAAICSALSCSQVALRLRENPHNKVCADCGEANPDWASVNLLLSICKSCAGTNFSHLDSGVNRDSPKTSSL